MTGKALVCRVYTRELPGCDNIQLGTCAGSQVIVSKDILNGEWGIFFDAETQLSEEFCQQHDLVRRKLDDGSDAGGYLEPNRRIRAIKLRGAKSDGLWMPLYSLNYTGANLSFAEGFQFDELNGYPICCKYVTPATARRIAHQKKSGKVSRGATLMFPKHFETEQFLRVVTQIPKGAIIYITEKLHGSSARFAHVLEGRPPKGFWEKCSSLLARLLGKEVHYHEWTYLNGSRNVILERRQGDGHYGAELFRFKATENITLHKGEVIYGELVGFCETGQPIMAPQSTVNLKNKEVTKKFGNQIVYKYGCAPNECKLFIYRITMANEDGKVIEYSWPQVVGRCRELGLTPAPEIRRLIFDGNHDIIINEVNRLVNGSNGSDAVVSSLDPTCLQEGVVVRYESEWGTGWLKHKGFLFKLLEGIVKEDDQYVDIEEVS